MPLSVNDGSQTATLNTEHTLDTITTPGSYILYVDTANMANGDITTFRVYLKVRSTGTTRLMDEVTYAHAQQELVKRSIPAASVNEIKFTLEQTAGTGRAYPWEIVQI